MDSMMLPNAEASFGVSFGSAGPILGFVAGRLSLSDIGSALFCSIGYGLLLTGSVVLVRSRSHRVSSILHWVIGVSLAFFSAFFGLIFARILLGAYFNAISFPIFDVWLWLAGLVHVAALSWPENLSRLRRSTLSWTSSLLASTLLVLTWTEVSERLILDPKIDVIVMERLTSADAPSKSSSSRSIAKLEYPSARVPANFRAIGRVSLGSSNRRVSSIYLVVNEPIKEKFSIKLPDNSSATWVQNGEKFELQGSEVSFLRKELEFFPEDNRLYLKFEGNSGSKIQVLVAEFL